MLVTTTHGWIDNSLKERFYNWLDRKMIKTCSRVIAISDAMRKDLSRPGLNLDKLITIHNAIDTDDFNSNCAAQDLRAELKLDKNTSVIGVVGRLSKEKMINTLFDILPEIIARAEDIKLLIAGDGPQRSNLESAIRNSGLKDKVIFLGNVKDIKRVYKTMDLLVSISTTDGLPNNILEALSMEVPVVATRVGGVSEIIEDGVNGLLFSKADINGIKDGIVKLLLDKQTAVQLAASGRNLVCEKFSFDKRMRKMEKIYSQLVEKGK